MQFPVLLDERMTISLTVILMGIHGVITSVESLYNYALYRRNHFLSWEYLRYSRTIFGWPSVGVLFHKGFRYPNVLFLIGFRLVATVFLIYLSIIGKWESLFITTLVSVTFLSVILGVRNTHSNIGADQLSNIVFIALSISYLGSPGGAIKLFSFVFIACQALLSYFTSGLFKLLEPDWRNGTFLKGILSTMAFGSPMLKSILDRSPGLYRVISLALIIWEVIMAGCLFYSIKVVSILLGIGVLFHFSIAIVMGLNTFFWAFIATYPSLYFICCKLK